MNERDHMHPAPVESPEPVSLEQMTIEYIPPRDRAEALVRLDDIAAEHESLADNGWAPVPVGLLRALRSTSDGHSS